MKTLKLTPTEKLTSNFFNVREIESILYCTRDYAWTKRVAKDELNINIAAVGMVLMPNDCIYYQIEILS